MIRGRKPGLDLTTIAIQLQSYLAMAGVYSLRPLMVLDIRVEGYMKYETPANIFAHII